jgi:hypothetical protein
LFRDSTRPVSAAVPLLVLPAVSALALVLGHAALYGAVHETDEGAAAHVFQILAALQVLALVPYAVTQGRRAPRRALPLLTVIALIWACSFLAVRAFT